MWCQEPPLRVGHVAGVAQMVAVMLRAGGRAPHEAVFQLGLDNLLGITPWPGHPVLNCAGVSRQPLRLATVSDPVGFYRVEKMKFGGKRPNLDRTTILYNRNITVTGIPLEAYEYVVNGKPAIEWVLERQGVSTDPTSGIINDANLFANEVMNDPVYPFHLLCRVITVSLETLKIVRSLPPLDVVEQTASKVPIGKTEQEQESAAAN
jgi:hypothetical protein